MAEKRARGSTNEHRSPVEVVDLAKRQVAELTGRPAQTVSAFKRTDDGWRVTVEVVDLERIPPSTSVLASYEAILDSQARLQECKRLRRYYQNQTDSQEGES